MFTPERITLTFYDRSAAAFGISWYTAAAGSPAIRYAPAGADLAAGALVPAGVSPGLFGYQNTGVLSLPPRQDYIYQVGDAAADVWSPPARLRRTTPHTPTRDDPQIPGSPRNGNVSWGGSFTFLFMSDTQDGVYRGTMWARAYCEALRDYPDAAFLVHGGDMVDSGRDPDQWRDMLAYPRPYVMSIPTLPASGNHSYWSWAVGEYSHIDAQHFHIDLPPQDTRHGIYYPVEFGDALLLVLNSGDTVEPGAALTAEQLAWVERELAATTKRWRLAVIHNPLYSPGKYGSRPDRNLEALGLREQLDGLFYRYGVQLCMCGHDHLYMRTHPIDGEGRVGAKGTVHFMAGCAGMQCRPPEDLSPSDAAVFAEYHRTCHRRASYAAVTVTPEALTVRYHTVDCDDPCARGILEHSFVIRR